MTDRISKDRHQAALLQQLSDRMEKKMTILKNPISMFALVLGAIWLVGSIWSAVLPIRMDPTTLEIIQPSDIY